MRVLGVDPDLHNTGMAIVEKIDDERPSVAILHVAQTPKDLKGDQAVRRMLLDLPVAEADSQDECVYLVVPIERGRNGLHSFDHAIVEGQESYRGKAENRATPDVLIRLAHVAGAAAREYGAQIVAPKVWKGSIPKEIKQARILTALGWSYVVRAGWCEPTEAEAGERFNHIKGKQWSHVIDAIGLALWKIEQLTS